MKLIKKKTTLFLGHLFFEREGEREREESRGGAERILSRLFAISTKSDMGLDLTNFEIVP